ncbi:MAG: hormogonium polysaccharide secretion pseudopilin HpsB [Leptolyngbyaceae cyanobacterium bins.59]|nr:hormogonium polysaccharide secretion pseudopilin HpsB [Leptolyngbyaceae cyanobacterium bins.59]
MLRPSIRRPLPNPDTSEAGFTIIESLIAIVVVAILLVSIAPIFVFAAANRLQARRVEIATQAARAYVDSIRSRAVPPPRSTGTDTLQAYPPPVAAGTLTCLPANVPNSSSAAADFYCTGGTNATQTLFCVDNDGSGCSTLSYRDMIIQAVRSAPTDNAAQGYRLGIRVYRADAFRGTGSLQRGVKQLPFAGQGGPRAFPLLEMTTEITPASSTFDDTCQRLGGC